MDQVSVIRMVAGVLAVVFLVIIVARRKRLACQRKTIA